MATLDDLFALLSTLILSVPRIMTAIWLLPILSQQIFPATVRTAFVFSLALVIFPAIYTEVPAGGFGIFDALVLAIKEIFIGLLIGFLFALPFWLTTAVGYIIDKQRGAFSASLFFPVVGAQVSPLGILFTQAVATLFFVSGGFLVMLKSLYYSYLMWPLTSVFPKINQAGLDFLISQFQWFAYTMLILAAPAAILMFLIDFSMGILNRFVPQLNVFFLSMPIKSLCAGLILIVYVPSLFGFFDEHFYTLFSLVQSMLRIL
jgi:type III secretion protein T